ncbi:hypothetical protein H8B02_39640 [Bradyrhizobium sp. Pear77]|uniref:hypothetical protein n=1 Tax=Bradyrhizobium altum TaxID=1571202 RepID=UPI001E372E81|nr:hypothetical protein [Bradyrhizobium altum]MCC8959300.1 hypothetical protein [Bradyrhizobium altum]
MFQFRHERHTHTDWSIENRQIKTTEVTIDAEVLYRDDGFKLIRLGKKWRYDGYFRYEKNGVSFEFKANRAHPGGTITGTYSVFLEFKRGRRLGDTDWPIPRSKVEEIAADIDAALRAWPTAPQQENIPVGVVSFAVRTSGAVPGSNPDPTSENDTRYEFTVGHPVTVRHVPPSTRWQRRLVPYRGGDKWRPDVVREREALIRDDGIQLIRFATIKGPADDGPDTYRYVEGDLSFDFYAERRMGMGPMTDTWEVQLDPDPRRHVAGLSSELRTRLGPDRCAEVVGNIEEALYAWPQWGYEYETPTNRVVFLDVNRCHIQ